MVGEQYQRVTNMLQTVKKELLIRLGILQRIVPQNLSDQNMEQYMCVHRGVGFWTLEVLNRVNSCTREVSLVLDCVGGDTCTMKALNRIVICIPEALEGVKKNQEPLMIRRIIDTTDNNLML